MLAAATEFLEPDAPLPGRRFVARNSREESFQQHLIEIVASQLGLDGATHKFRSFAQEGDGLFLAPGFQEEFLLAEPTLVPQTMQLQGINAMSLSLQSLLQ